MMGVAWIIWAVLIVLSFAVIEGYALKHPERQWTLSRCMSYLGANWPGTIFLFGGLTFGMAVHFFWHFCP